MDYPCRVTKTLNELFGKQVNYTTFFAHENRVMFFRPMTYRLDNICVELFVRAYQIPEILAYYLQVTPDVSRLSFPIAYT
jgi:hypothetical protein